MVKAYNLAYLDLSHGVPLKPAITWFAVDAVLLIALYGVYQDQVWRGSCQASFACTAQVSSASYSLLTMVTRLTASGVPLLSPLTLDWVQVFIVVLVMANGYFVFVWLRERRRPAPNAGLVP